MSLQWLQDGEMWEYEPLPERALGSYSFAPPAQAQQVVLAKDIMQTQLVTVESERSAGKAFELFQAHGFQHLPVTDSDRVVGLLSDRDLFGADWANMTVGHLMTRRLLTARPETALWLVARIMIDYRVNCVLVVDAEQCLQGLLTSLDLLSCMTYQAPLDVWL